MSSVVIVYKRGNQQSDIKEHKTYSNAMVRVENDQTFTLIVHPYDVGSVVAKYPFQDFSFEYFVEGSSNSE